MKITNNVETNVVNNLDYGKELQKKEKTKTLEKSEIGAEVEISKDVSTGNFLTYQELQCAIENIAASESSILSIEQAEEMINRANKHILENSNEAVLAQANQTAPAVAELTK